MYKVEKSDGLYITFNGNTDCVAVVVALVQYLRVPSLLEMEMISGICASY